MRAPTASQCAIERVIVRIGHRRKAEQAGMVAEAREQIRLAQGLIRAAADAADPDQRFGAPRVRAIHFFGGDREHRLEQADAGSRIANWVVCTPTASPPLPAAA